uniref:Reverse transcriptase domain-containing protein n=1 Tax=Felis catus TaxID=9685 RepID=A0ABI7WDX7_FELCA
MPEERHPPPPGEAHAVPRAGGRNTPGGSPPFTRQRAQREQSASTADSTILPLRATGPPDAEGNQPHHYWPFATSDLYNWKAQNPKFSEKPAGLIDLLDSVLFTHQPTWDDCRQLLQVLFMTEERERILNEARKLVPGADGNPTTNQAQIDASFPLTRPQWDFNTAEDLKDAFFSLPLAPQSQPLFAFEWHDPEEGYSGQLTWTRLPQGFKNSPTIFDEALHEDLGEYRREHPGITLLQYVDDILIAADTAKDCERGTQDLLATLGALGYRASAKKAQICRERIHQQDTKIEQVVSACKTCQLTNARATSNRKKEPGSEAPDREPNGKSTSLKSNQESMVLNIF